MGQVEPGAHHLDRGDAEIGAGVIHGERGAAGQRGDTGDDIGPAIVGLAIGPLGIVGVIWIFALLYLLSAILAFFLRLPPEQPAPATAQQPTAGRDIMVTERP